uniref:Selenoprotein H n=1 Tax=Timema poppense TaxID=170557 RepID=A0A7R9D2B9_TIMPO|nr:unnamed protein product [Timema poppensis]
MQLSTPRANATSHKAAELVAALKIVWPNTEVVINATKPRRGSFEFTLLGIGGKETLIWSGIKKGPPRKEKFPTSEILIEAIKGVI